MSQAPNSLLSKLKILYHNAKDECEELAKSMGIDVDNFVWSCCHHHVYDDMKLEQMLKLLADVIEENDEESNVTKRKYSIYSGLSKRFKKNRI